MTLLLLALVALYLIARTLQPVFLIKENTSQFIVRPKFVLLPGSSLYVIYATDRVIIPTGQWREIPTGVTLAPFGVVKIGKYTFFPLGRMVCRVYSLPELKLKGLEILPTVYSMVPRKEITLIGTGWNPKSAFVVHAGDPVAYVEFYRVPMIKLWEIIQ